MSEILQTINMVLLNKNWLRNLYFLADYFLFKCNLFKIFATVWTIFVEFVCAMFLPSAFPPTVNEATNALIKNCKLNGNVYIVVIFIETNALMAPLKTPQISPITSAQKLATLAEFRINFTDVFAPVIFLLAFAWNSSSSATVTATPITSKIIPINITINSINIAGIKGKLLIAFEDIKEKVIDKIKVVIKTVINHLMAELSDLFLLLLFCLSLFFVFFCSQSLVLVCFQSHYTFY